MALKDMRYIKCDVYPNVLVTSEASKGANLILKELKLDIPENIFL
jgi:hypothetical protein